MGRRTISPPDLAASGGLPRPASVRSELRSMTPASSSTLQGPAGRLKVGRGAISAMARASARAMDVVLLPYRIMFITMYIFISSIDLSSPPSPFPLPSGCLLRTNLLPDTGLLRASSCKCRRRAGGEQEESRRREREGQALVRREYRKTIQKAGKRIRNYNTLCL